MAKERLQPSRHQAVPHHAKGAGVAATDGYTEIVRTAPVGQVRSHQVTEPTFSTLKNPVGIPLPNGITMCASIGRKWQHTGLLYLHQLRHNDWSHLVRPFNLPLYIDAHLIGTVFRSALSGNIVQSIPCSPKIKV